jgi:transposase-like protein
MKRRGRQGVDDEFRREAVRLAESGTMPIAEVARQLGINTETLRNWRRKAREGSDTEGQSATVPSLEERIDAFVGTTRGCSRSARFYDILPDTESVRLRQHLVRSQRKQRCKRR